MLDKDTNHEVDELIRRSTQMEVPAEVESRLRGRLAEFRTRVEQRPPSRLRALIFSLTQGRWLRTAAATAALLLAVGAGLVLIPGMYTGSRAYAAAVAQLRSSSSLEYTVVLNSEPYVGVELSFLEPGFERINCSWGIEVRADHSAGKQMVLFHAARTYLMEEGKPIKNVADSENFLEQLRSLPQTADASLGEKQDGGKRLLGYRLRQAPPNGGIPGLKALDVWVDAGTKEAHHVDITVQEAGKPEHTMHIQNIRAGAAVDRSLFDLTPPAGYAAFGIPAGTAQTTKALRAEIRQSGAMVAMVVPMSGSFLQTPAALQKVEGYLKARGVTPVGAPLGLFESEQNWQAGYPVLAGTLAEPPFQILSMPAGLAASVVVNGAWGGDSSGRWGAFLQSVVEQGYMPAGPAMEIWSGEEAKPATQSTEMRMAVTRAN